MRPCPLPLLSWLLLSMALTACGGGADAAAKRGASAMVTPSTDALAAAAVPASDAASSADAAASAASEPASEASAAIRSSGPAPTRRGSSAKRSSDGVSSSSTTATAMAAPTAVGAGAEPSGTGAEAGPRVRIAAATAAESAPIAGASALAIVSATSTVANRFDAWSQALAGALNSPALEARRPDDLYHQWAGVDGATVRLLVRQPELPAQASTLTIKPIAADADARPVFEKAMATLRGGGIRRLVVEPGVYNFRSLSQARAHWVIEKLRDVDIVGSGATLNFHQDSMGIWLEQSQRVRLQGFTLNYALRTSSLGTVKLENGKRVLEIDPAFPVTNTTKVFQLQEIDAATKTFVPGGGRLIFLPGAADPATWVRPQTYSSPLLDKFGLNVGARFGVLHQYYGGVPIRIDGQPGAQQTEDITLSKLRILAAPGMGVTVRGVRRGMALVDSVFEPPTDGSNYLSTNWDGIHVLQIGGDLLIRGNRFSGMMDDAINVVGTPVHIVDAVDRDKREVVLSNYSRFVLAGQDLAFFDNNANLLGSARVRSISPLATDVNRHRISLDALPNGVAPQQGVRSLQLAAARYLVSDNLIEKCSCHAILVQAANGLVQNNTVRSINRNAIRVLTSLSSWREGVGGFNVAVRRNSIDNTGFDDALDLPWSAISVYGESGGRVSPGLVNRGVEISGNSLRNLRQGCITVANTQSAVIKQNLCLFATPMSSRFVTRSSAQTALTVLRSAQVETE